ncbi:MAG TPA: lytic murein transglycosylase, partial [Legionella sp.]|nr:lytic murein transglycosylase [Legionella sp.]
AIDLMTVAHPHHIMSDAQEQQFLAHLALFKAMRNEPDAARWFAKVKPAFYNETLLEWEMRFALTHHQWRKVVYLISKSANRREPNNQYWMARALEALGEKETSSALYKQLAAKRSYYGFLASLKLKQKPSFENEYTPPSSDSLLLYKPITDQIKALYLSHQIVDASKLLNDFVSELPKPEKSALAYWVANHLHWHGKSIYLSNNDALNNQLSLRFPLAYQDSVREYGKNYQIPPAFIYAVIRQESAFQEGISSPAGANGLMQLMPATARHIAKQARIPYTEQKQLFTSQKNIHIGTAYLQQLSKQFHQHPILMAAAYNAGPRQVNYWLKHHAPKEMDIWIETLPWRETRNYLKNIMAFYAVYQYRMKERPSLEAFMQPL